MDSSHVVLLRAFLTAKEAAGLSPRSLIWYEDQLAQFVREGVRFERSAVEAFLAAQRRTGIAGATLHARFRALRAWCNWLHGRKLIADNPLLDVAAPKVAHKLARVATLEQLQRLLASIEPETWLDARDRVLLQLFLFTGVRLAEMTGLQTGDVLTAEHTIVVRGGKGAKDRFVFYPASLDEDLLGYLYARPAPADGPLWVASDGYAGVRGALTAEGIRQVLKRRCAAAGVPPLNPHAFRHGFASLMLNAGARMSTISAIMGHADEQVTRQVYARYWRSGLQREYAEVVGRLGNG